MSDAYEEALTLNEWTENTPGALLLYRNLRTNLEVMTDLDEDEVIELLRVHMIMVRQFSLDLTTQLSLAVSALELIGRSRALNGDDTASAQLARDTLAKIKEGK